MRKFGDAKDRRKVSTKSGKKVIAEGTSRELSFRNSTSSSEENFVFIERHL